MGNAIWYRASGSSPSRRSRTWRLWSWCSVCNEAYLYNHRARCDSASRRRTAALPPHSQRPKGQEDLGDTYTQQLGDAREQHARAAADGDTALVALLEAIFPVLKPGPAPPPESALQQLQHASMEAMRARRKLYNAIDWAAKLRVELKDAEEAAVKLHVEARVAAEAHATAREAHARTCALPEWQRQPLASTPTATALFVCDLQGLEHDDEFRAARAHFQQQVFVQRVQATRAAASPAPTPVPAATPPGARLPVSCSPAAHPNFGTSGYHEMGEADNGKRKDADRQENEAAKRAKHARVQLLADVKSAEDEQRKQLGATSEG